MQNIREITFGGGIIYTIEAVADLPGIPRPTLYRHLKGYSIPHLRRAGGISTVPGEFFEKIRRARDLHEEGLGTEPVPRAVFPNVEVDLRDGASLTRALTRPIRGGGTGVGGSVA